MTTRTLKLMGLESTYLMMMIPAVSTITFYEGRPPIDVLRNRVQEIATANPWIQSKLVKFDNALSLKYDMNQQCSCFQISEDPVMRHDMKYEEMTSRVNHLTVKEGNKCLDKDELLFRVTLICLSDNRFAIFFSISHLIADGFTFYKLYGMLSPSSTVESLIVDRFYDFEKNLDAEMGGNDTLSWTFTAGATVSILLTLLFGAKAVVDVNYVNTDWVEDQKRKHVASKDVPFISTNDVLTSSLFGMSRCDIGMMAVNFRDRMSELTKQHAGNYEALIGYQPADYNSPGLIRQSLANFRRQISGALPAFIQSWMTRVCVVSSWATFYVDCEFENCKQVWHVPYFENKGVAFSDIYILFKPTKSTLALVTIGRSVSSRELRNVPFLSAVVS